jgi:hypothetical protein
MTLVSSVLAVIRRDYAAARGLGGYIRNRFLEKTTWSAIGAAVIAANTLEPLYGAASVAVAIIVALLPSPAAK